MSVETARETRGFETEVKQLLDLMIHSLYSNKEIFLRELISNASDAADKLRFEALSNDALYEGDGELAIDIDLDRDARTVTVRDNGVGMGYQEVIDHLGTIAKSGTREFFQALGEDKAHAGELIGQFGVGFYSSFIVADRVTVTTRRAGVPPEGGVRWESSGEGAYTVERLDVPRRGTEVVLHLREGEDEFLDGHRLRSIVRRYSDHISLPIRMPAEGEDDAGPETVNSARALWTRGKHEIGEDEYNAFYKHVAHDFEDPLAHVHSRVEGNLEYTSLLFVPSRAPFDLWDRNVRRGVKLYVRRVFVMDDAEQLMPPYLRFVRGVVDSADLPLNISREILQQNRQIDSIRAGSVKRVLDLLGGLAENEPDKYRTFWDEFGRVFKEGIIDDPKNREAIAGLLRFTSTHSDGDAADVSLADYVSRMKEGQEHVYYLTADNPTMARSSPHLEIFRSRDIEVLLLTDEIDEWVVHHLDEFEGKPLRSIAKGELDLGSLPGGDTEAGTETEDGADGGDGEAGDLASQLGELLGDRVKEVRSTSRLVDSPACLVADEHDMGAHLERLLKAAGQKIEGSKPILEINPKHPLLVRLAAEEDEQRRRDWAGILLDQALLSEGGRLDDPGGFVRRLNEMLLALARPPATRRKKAKPKAKAKAKAKARSKAPSEAKDGDGAEG